MEIDSIPYIFGSFARRRQSQDVSSSKRRSVDPGVQSTSPSNRRIFPTSTYQHERTKSAPHQRLRSSGDNSTPMGDNVGEIPGFLTSASQISPTLASSTSTLLHGTNSKSSPAVIVHRKCPVCLGHFVDPRVLPCLHTCCLRCLQQLEVQEAVIGKEHSNDTSGTGSKPGAPSDGSWRPTTHKRKVTCPSCGRCSQLGPQGVFTLPPNYTLQHRMILNTLNSSATKLLCDVCTTTITAISRCTECARNLCAECASTHKQQTSTSSHEILILEEARRRGITKVRKQIMCVVHPENVLSTFCSTCSQVLCNDCTTTPAHYRHSFDTISRAAKVGATNVRLALDRARSIAHKSSVAVAQLQGTAEWIQVQCARVQEDIDVFMGRYKEALEQHHKELVGEVGRAREQQMLEVVGYTMDLQKQVREARDVATFADELLREGEPVEVLTFARLIRERVEGCSDGVPSNGDGVRGLRVSESLQFLPEELVPTKEACSPLYGVVTTQTVAPNNCCLLNIDNLKNLRVGRRVFALLETRDRNNKPLQRGGEAVQAELHQHDAGIIRTLPIIIEDLGDGTYKIEFRPDVAGKLVLTVYIKGHIIKDGPIAIIVRTVRPHRGLYHCCTFCSSGGSKEARCACAGRMPGGYRGCGHGHGGHPGRPHWSCCGHALEHSECTAAARKCGGGAMRQFTL